jgi:hypothetical protein
MSCGGSMKKMQKGGMVKSIIKPFVKKVVKKITKPTTPKMAVGGTTTKRIIKKSTGGMYGIPQENLGTSGQYGFAKKGGATKKYQKGGSSNNDLKGVHAEPRVRMSGPLTEKDTKMIANMEIQGDKWKGVPYASPRSEKKYGRPDSQRRNFENYLREESAISKSPKRKNLDWDMSPAKKISEQKKGGTHKMQNGGTTKADPYGDSSVKKSYDKSRGNMGPTKIVPKKVKPYAPKASKTRTIERDGTFEMKKGGATKKYQKGGQPSDSTAWKNRTLPNLTKQGLAYEIGRLSKMVTPKSLPSIIQQKIDMLKREKIRRTTVKKVTTNKKK